jgi:hypothetical protein
MCTKCETELGTWQCLECFSASSLCSQCCADVHWHHPYHQVRYWSGSYYQPSWLFHTRLKIHISHDGEPCPFFPHSQPVSPTEPQSLPFPTLENLEEEVIVQDIADPIDLGEDPNWIDIPEEPAVPSHPAADHQDDNPFLDQIGQTGSIDMHCTPGSTLPQAAKPTPIRLSAFAKIYDSSEGYSAGPPTRTRLMTIVDRSGVHQVNVQLCQCPGAELHREDQMLQAGLFPASFKIIKTTFTYHYFQKLRCLTSLAFPDAVSVISLLIYMLPQYNSFNQDRYWELLCVS